jgi:DNA-directed RNA polymerase specialized sigma24 family protein
MMTLGREATAPPLDDRRGEPPLRQLLRRVARVDRTAFALLYDAMSGQVRRQAAAALASSDAVDAVVAATFLQVWWLAPLYRPDDIDVPAWISGIAASRIADHQRDAVPMPSTADADDQQRWPTSVLSSAYDETVAVVLSGLLGRRGPQKAF